ncbi:hypothetical protein [Nocardia tengchongensis]|uniref:hypothetical protein n=1 Tax=Nocardia tengchongensis TaxID=2055889 RepID=UPI0036805848
MLFELGLVPFVAGAVPASVSLAGAKRQLADGDGRGALLEVLPDQGATVGGGHDRSADPCADGRNKGFVVAITVSAYAPPIGSLTSADRRTRAEPYMLSARFRWLLQPSGHPGCPVDARW